ncbi:hypothetical protein Rs2_50671 [Raphanus sativus]|nr:hypothetical protein Rs2_50671 [Raphanus sativus]
MARKKSAKGKGSNGSSGSRPRPSVSKSPYVPTHRSDSDSTAGKAASEPSPAIDARDAAAVVNLANNTDAPTAPVADLAMEIAIPNLETLATEVTTKAVYRPVDKGNSGSSNATAGKSTADPVARTPPPPQRSSPPPRAKEVGNRHRSLSPNNNHSQRIKSPPRTTIVEFDSLREGGLFVDLSPYAVSPQSNGSLSSGHSSGHLSDENTSLSWSNESKRLSQKCVLLKKVLLQTPLLLLQKL